MAHTHHIAQRNPLEISALAEFDRNIAHLSEVEQNEKRLLYLEQALKQMANAQKMIKVFGCLFLPIMIIPIFWPFLIMLYFMLKKSRRIMDDYVVSACRYWGIEGVAEQVVDHRV